MTLIESIIASEVVDTNGRGHGALAGVLTDLNALVVGVNENLSDTMIYVKYNVENGKIYKLRSQFIL